MIDYIKGEIAELTPASVTIDVNGIGYFVQISVNTYTAISKKKETKLFIFESIREDAYLLFGFSDKQERDIFILLISVSGVGASTARMILSSMTAQELETVITSEDVNLLKTVKGIGLKTAQRIIVDLKDKIRTMEKTGISLPQASSNSIIQEAVAALVMLGFTQNASHKAVTNIMRQTPTATIEQAIKAALKIL